ncbi:MAG TPA: polysaccharide biosynthesis/export family protein [Burkholderiales bacterium]|nr:polysaccharide biosynthesis/export family protein [Burkholderiales bacterium]
MNCQDISRIADTGRIRTLPEAERLAAEAHVLSCSRCAAVWSVHSGLLALDVPPMPAEVSLRLGTMAALPVRQHGRYSPRRLGVIGGLVVLSAAAGMFIWRMGESQLPVSSPAAGGVVQLPVDDAHPTGDTVPTMTLPPARPTASATVLLDEAAMCEQTLSDLEQFALQELAAVESDPSTERDEDWWRVELENLQHRAAGSRDPELFLTSVLLDPPERKVSEDPLARTTLVDLGVRATEAASPLMAWHALRACVEAGQSCPYEHLVQRLFEADRENAESWALLATFRYRRGDVAGALAAMQGAARAPKATVYWAQTVALAERSLAARTEFTFQDRIGAAFGAAAGTLPSPSALGDMCRAESTTRRAWGEACLAFGVLRGERADTTMAQLLAYSIRERAMTALGETGLAAEDAAGYALFGAQRVEGGLAPVGSLFSALYVTNPARLHAYLDAIQQFGEEAGARVVYRQQLPLLLQRAGLLEREGVRECVAQYFEPRTPMGTRAATAAHQFQVADEFMVSVRGGRNLSTVARVRPDGTFMMPLTAATTTGRTTADELERQITAGGRAVGPLEQEIAAVGKTPGELEREIVTLLTRRDQTPEVLVILLSPRSREQLRLEFDNALREAAE